MDIICHKDMESLVASGLLGSPNVDGTRLIHKRRLNRWSDKDNFEMPLVPISTDMPFLFCAIPERLISLATLRYLGYGEETAAYIWGVWRKRLQRLAAQKTSKTGDASDAVAFIDFATTYVEAKRDKDAFEDRDQDWYDFMNDCGINAELQNAIMDPAFKHIRLSESCLFWITDTFKLRYRGLKEVQRASAERAMGLMRKDPPPEVPSCVQRALPHKGDSDTKSTANYPIPKVNLFETAARLSRQITKFNIAPPGTKDSPRAFMLYKGIDRAQVEKMRDSSGHINHIWPLLSHSLTGSMSDCSGLGLYFAASLEVASGYAHYMKRRDDASSIVILRTRIPKYIFKHAEKLRALYWPDPRWKNLIYHYRGDKKLPRGMCGSLRRISLIVGTVSTKPRPVYKRMTSSEEITEDHLFRDENGVPAVQYVLRGKGGMRIFEKYGISNIALHPLTHCEYKFWCLGHRQDPMAERSLFETIRMRLAMW